MGSTRIGSGDALVGAGAARVLELKREHGRMEQGYDSTLFRHRVRRRNNGVWSFHMAA